MKLIACHINNFGKLSDLNINFNDGVNVINQPNGWGKSTLAAFLKAMLYGFDTKKEPAPLRGKESSISHGRAALMVESLILKPMEWSTDL